VELLGCSGWLLSHFYAVGKMFWVVGWLLLCGCYTDAEGF